VGTYEPLSDDTAAAIEDAVPSETRRKTIQESSMELEVARFSIYSLLQEVNNGILFFGKVRVKGNTVTAEFICTCGESFRSELDPIICGAIKSCGCNKKN